MEATRSEYIKGEGGIAGQAADTAHIRSKLHSRSSIVWLLFLLRGGSTWVVVVVLWTGVETRVEITKCKSCHFIVNFLKNFNSVYTKGECPTLVCIRKKDCIAMPDSFASDVMQAIMVFLVKANKSIPGESLE